MKKNSLLVVLILLFLAGIFIQYKFGLTDKIFYKRRKQSKGTKFGRVAKKFIKLFNTGDKKAYKYTYPFLVKKLLQKAAKKKKNEIIKEEGREKYRKDIIKDDREIIKILIKKKFDFLQKFRGKRTYYKLIQLNEKELTTKILAKIPTLSTSNNELFYRKITTTLKWFEYNGKYYVYDNLVFNDKDGVINEKTFIFGNVEGPKEDLKVRLNKVSDLVL